MKRWIPAPKSDSQPHSNAVLGVSLNKGEQVQWAYRILPDGKQVVTGYDIIPPQLPKTIKKWLARSANKPSHKHRKQ
jgi:hypothetical protein